MPPRPPGPRVGKPGDARPHEQAGDAWRTACARADLYREAGIEVAAFFIVGYPGETVADIEKTFALALSLPLDEISFNVPMPLPGSPLYERLGGEDPGRDWTHENELTFVFRLGHRRGVAAARVAETMAAFAAKATGVSAGAGRARRSAPREAQGGGGEAPEPPPHLELRLPLEQREPHLRRREVAGVGHLLVEQRLAPARRARVSRSRMRSYRPVPGSGYGTVRPR